VAAALVTAVRIIRTSSRRRLSKPDVIWIPTEAVVTAMLKLANVKNDVVYDLGWRWPHRSRPQTVRRAGVGVDIDPEPIAEPTPRRKARVTDKVKFFVGDIFDRA
jgi:hypothetical protein